MADFTTSGPNFSIFVSGFENLETLAEPSTLITVEEYDSGPSLVLEIADNSGLMALNGPSTLITVEEYPISGGILSVDFESNLVPISTIQYLDTSESYPTSGVTVSLALGLVISGSPPTALPTSGQIWPINI